jgi:hypothetical protein
MNKCDIIEPLIYLTDDELNQAEQQQLQEHLKNCSRCSEIRVQVLKNRNLLLVTPDSSELVFPDFPDQTRQSAVSGRTLEHPAILKLFRWVGWSSAVAACLLLILFLGEQAQTVRKIAALEENLAGIIYTDAPGMVDRWALKESVNLLKEANGQIRPTPFNMARINRNHFTLKSGQQTDYRRYRTRILTRHPFFYNAFIIQSQSVSR